MSKKVVHHYEHKNFYLIDYFHNFKEHVNEFIFDKLSLSKEVESFHLNLIENSFFKKIKTPIWFINKSVYENFYLKYKTLILSKSAINYFNEKGLYLYLVEPLNFYEDCFLENRLLKYLDKFVENNYLKKVKIFTCEKNVEKLDKKYKHITVISKNIFLAIVSKYITETVLLEPDLNMKLKRIEKKFWCGNITYNQHRHFIISFLYSKSGNYSWYHKKSLIRNEFYCPKFLQNINDDKVFLDTVARDNKKYFEILLYNDKELNEKCPIKMDNRRSSKSKTIIKYYDECFCSVVTETTYNSPYADISEKTLYAIAYAKPFIIVGAPGCLEYLKDLGFMTFEDFWDESYDKEKDPQKRMLKIFDLLEHIDDYSIEDLKNLYMRMYPILNHNLNVLKTLQYNGKVFT